MMTVLEILILVFICICTGICVRIVVLRSLNKISYLQKTRKKLTLNDICQEPILAQVIFIALAFLLSVATSMSFLPILLVVAIVFAYRLPKMVKKAQAKELREKCDAHIDDLADIVGMCIRSGLSFDASLKLYCEKFDNVLSKQMHLALLSWQGGMVSRSRALQEMADRIGSAYLKRFNDTVIQAVVYGSPLAEMLARFSHDIRTEKRARIEEKIAKAPVKMLVPTGICILPAMLILVAGPVIIQFVSSGF